MAVRLTVRRKESEFLQGLRAVLKPMEVAAHAAVTEAGKLAVKEGNAHIASKGFTDKKWRGLRSTVEPKKPSMDVAATITHSFGPAAVFEFGGPIKARPGKLLWLPIEANLPGGGRIFHWTPRLFTARFGKLASAGGSGKPILVGKVHGETVPVFHGVEQVNIRKRFDIAGVVERVAAGLVSLYAKHLRI